MDNQVDWSNLEANTRSWREERQIKKCVQVTNGLVLLTSHWLRKWREK